jgi:hypothetical protein
VGGVIISYLLSTQLNERDFDKVQFQQVNEAVIREISSNRNATLKEKLETGALQLLLQDKLSVKEQQILESVTKA